MVTIESSSHTYWMKEKIMAYNIAIDGPAGAGKSTIAKKLAADLGYVYVDTGAMYRAMAYYFLQNGIDAKDEKAIADACPKVDVTIQYVDGEQQVILNGENVNGVIRKEEVGNMASATSVYPVVRTKLVDLQRQLAARENVIMDGRDIGTVVLPNANVKIFLTAICTLIYSFLMIVLNSLKPFLSSIFIVSVNCYIWNY